MEKWDVFLIITALLGFIGTSYAMFYKPSHELKIEIVKLNENLSAVNKKSEEHDDTLREHGKRLSNHEIRIDRLERTDFVKVREN